MPVTKVKDNTGAFARAIATLVKQQVLVGVPEGSDRSPEPGESAAPLNNASIAYIQEYGAPEANIPPRPFLMPGVESVRDRVADTYKKAATATLSGDLAVVESAHAKVGLIAQSAVQGKITNGPFAPLSKRTLQRRKARGFQGEKPLIETGQLRRSINYIIRNKGDSSAMTGKERAAAAGRKAVADALATGNFESGSDRAGREGLSAVANALGL